MKVCFNHWCRATLYWIFASQVQYHLPAPTDIAKCLEELFTFLTIQTIGKKLFSPHTSDNYDQVFLITHRSKGCKYPFRPYCTYIGQTIGMKLFPLQIGQPIGIKLFPLHIGHRIENKLFPPQISHRIAKKFFQPHLGQTIVNKVFSPHMGPSFSIHT